MNIIRTIILTAATLLASAAAKAQAYRGSFTNEDLRVAMNINLYADSIPVPGIDDERCYGYLRGNLNGTWIILKVKKLSEKKAVVRAACDNGSEAQDIELTPAGDGRLTFRQLDTNNIKTIEGRKYVKLPKTVEFRK